MVANSLSRVQGTTLLALAVPSIEPTLLVDITESWKDDIDIQQLMARIYIGEATIVIYLGWFSST